jgi:hypothetical protein
MWVLTISCLLMLACIGTGMLLQRSERLAAGSGFMKPLLWIFQLGFGCHHSRVSRVFTIKKRMYQVCFECGQELEYSWALMRPLRSNVTDNAHAPLTSARRADNSVV